MNNQEQINCDLLVIGRGFAGMVAVDRASALGLKTVQAGSSSSLFLDSGLIDLLGVYPVNKLRIVKDPEVSLAMLKTDIPDHPYSKISNKKLFESLYFLFDSLNDADLAYEYQKGENFFILTAAGTFKPSFMVPKTCLNGCAKNLNNKRVLFVDFKGLKGYSARQISNVVHKLCPRSSALTIEVPGRSGDMTPMMLAGLFEDDQFLAMITKIIRSKIDNIDLVGFPAMCGINNSLEIVEQIEKMIGCACFEIPGLPPSIPGLRFKNAFEKKMSQNNVTVLNKAKMRFDSFKDHTFFMTAVNRNMNTSIQAKGVILATGRFQGGGLHAKRGLIQESIFHLPVYQPERRNQWYDLNFFHPDGHAVNQAGIETNEMFQPVDKKNIPEYDNLYAAGSILACNDWVRLKSGSGVSCVSAVTAVDHFYARLKGGQ
ncbi:MAG: glycerol-3-phosphate dehydrogenase subunit GlpB [Desulfobacula sp.]|nr:glycerol-3-phosphate dehydrogenase subunit GlpB [Desulfobacula sp.]